MHQKVREALSIELTAFAMYLKDKDIVLDVSSSEEIIRSSEVVAQHFTEFFSLPCPMVSCHVSTLLQQVQIEGVYLQQVLRNIFTYEGNGQQN